MDEGNNLSMDIINYEKEHDLTDNEMAFGSQLSVERVHDIKSEAMQLLKKKAYFVALWTLTNNHLVFSSNDDLNY